jgi:ribosome maturation factor RimP
MNEEKKRILAEVEGVAHEVASMLGLEIVEFVFHGQGRHSLLRIDIDRPGLPGVGLTDCERFSRTLGDRIEDLTFFDAPYELQVSSPGIDRPIRSDDDLRRNTGRPIWMEYRDDVGKIRELRGTLVGPHGLDAVAIAGDDGDLVIARDRIVFMKQGVTLGGRPRNKP